MRRVLARADARAVVRIASDLERWLDGNLAQEVRARVLWALETDLPPRLETEAWLAAARLGIDEGELESSLECAVRAVERARALGDASLVVQTIVQLAFVQLHSGRDDDARASAAEAVALAATTDDWTQGRAHYAAAGTAADVATALESAEVAAAFFERTGDATSAGSVWGFVGYTAHLEGDLALAERLFTRALAVAAVSESGTWRAYLASNLGVVAVEAGDFDSARQRFAETLALCRAGGLRRLVFEPLAALAVIAAETDDLEGAAELAGAAAATRLEPLNAIDDRLEARLQAAKQAPGWDAAFTAGTRLSFPDAIELGLAAAQPQDGRAVADAVGQRLHPLSSTHAVDLPDTDVPRLGDRHVDHRAGAQARRADQPEQRDRVAVALRADRPARGRAALAGTGDGHRRALDHPPRLQRREAHAVARGLEAQPDRVDRRLARERPRLVDDDRDRDLVHVALGAGEAEDERARLVEAEDRRHEAVGRGRGAEVLLDAPADAAEDVENRPLGCRATAGAGAAGQAAGELVAPAREQHRHALLAPRRLVRQVHDQPRPDARRRLHAREIARHARRGWRVAAPVDRGGDGRQRVVDLDHLLQRRRDVAGQV